MTELTPGRRFSGGFRSYVASSHSLVCDTVSEVRLYPRIGNVAKVSRLTVMRVVVGKDCCTRETAELTYCSVWNMSTFQSKKRLTSADPRLVIERTVSSPGTEFTASSTGLVIVTSICSTG